MSSHPTSDAPGASSKLAPTASACLYLGRAGDPDTQFLQPNPEHRCYATAPESSIALPDQRAYCFGQCEACPRYVPPAAPGRRGSPRPLALADADDAELGAGANDHTSRSGFLGRLARMSFEEVLVLVVTTALVGVIAVFALMGGRDPLADLPSGAAESDTATSRSDADDATADAEATASPEASQRSEDRSTPGPSSAAASAAGNGDSESTDGEDAGDPDADDPDDPDAETPDPGPTSILPTPPPGGLVAALAPGERGAGSFSEALRLPAYGERELRVGSFAGERYLGGLLFPLSKIPPSARVSYVALELAGLSDSARQDEGEWTVEMLDPEVAEEWSDLTFASLREAPAEQSRTVWRLAAEDLAPRKVNVLELDADARDLFMQRLEAGRIAFRITGPADPEEDNLFIWDTGYGEGFGTRPVLRVAFVPPTPTPTPPGSGGEGGEAAATALPFIVWLGEPTPAPPAPTPTAYPESLYDQLRGKIIFVSDRFSVPEGAAQPPAGFRRPRGLTQPEQLMVYDPDSGRIGQVTESWPWTLAVERNARGADVQVGVGAMNQLMIHDRYSEQPRELVPPEGDNYDPSVSPDGEWIVFVSNRHLNDEIYRVRRNGQDLQRLTENDWQWDKHPSISPDGGQIVFWSNRDGRRQLYLMNADGSGQRNISNNSFNDWSPVWVR